MLFHAFIIRISRLLEISSGSLDEVVPNSKTNHQQVTPIQQKRSLEPCAPASKLASADGGLTGRTGHEQIGQYERYLVAHRAQKGHESYVGGSGPVCRSLKVPRVQLPRSALSRFSTLLQSGYNHVGRWNYDRRAKTPFRICWSAQPEPI